MCKCHFYNEESKQIEHTKGLFSLRTATKIGDTFQFPHEQFKRIVTDINHKASELVAIPQDEKYTGLDERSAHTFHFSFTGIF